MKPHFSTKHFDVYRFETQPTESLTIPRLIYVATFREIDWPGQVVTVCVMLGYPLSMEHVGNREVVRTGAYVDWIETVEMYQRKGYAAELCRAIEKDLNTPLVVCGVTRGGKALQRAWAKRSQRAEAGGA